MRSRERWDAWITRAHPAWSAKSEDEKNEEMGKQKKIIWLLFVWMMIFHFDKWVKKMCIKNGSNWIPKCSSGQQCIVGELRCVLLGVLGLKLGHENEDENIRSMICQAWKLGPTNNKFGPNWEIGIGINWNKLEQVGTIGNWKLKIENWKMKIENWQQPCLERWGVRSSEHAGRTHDEKKVPMSALGALANGRLWRRPAGARAEQWRSNREISQGGQWQ